MQLPLIRQNGNNCWFRQAITMLSLYLGTTNIINNEYLKRHFNNLTDKYLYILQKYRLINQDDQVIFDAVSNDQDLQNPEICKEISILIIFKICNEMVRNNNKSMMFEPLHIIYINKNIKLSLNLLYIMYSILAHNNSAFDSYSLYAFKEALKVTSDLMDYLNMLNKTGLKVFNDNTGLISTDNTSNYSINDGKFTKTIIEINISLSHEHCILTEHSVDDRIAYSYKGNYTDICPEFSMYKNLNIFDFMTKSIDLGCIGIPQYLLINNRPGQFNEMINFYGWRYETIGIVHYISNVHYASSLKIGGRWLYYDNNLNQYINPKDYNNITIILCKLVGPVNDMSIKYNVKTHTTYDADLYNDGGYSNDVKSVIRFCRDHDKNIITKILSQTGHFINHELKLEYIYYHNLLSGLTVEDRAQLYRIIMGYMNVNINAGIKGFYYQQRIAFLSGLDITNIMSARRSPRGSPRVSARGSPKKLDISYSKMSPKKGASPMKRTTPSKGASPMKRTTPSKGTSPMKRTTPSKGTFSMATNYNSPEMLSNIKNALNIAKRDLNSGKIDKDTFNEILYNIYELSPSIVYEFFRQHENIFSSYLNENGHENLVKSYLNYVNDNNEMNVNEVNNQNNLNNNFKQNLFNVLNNAANSNKNNFDNLFLNIYNQSSSATYNFLNKRGDIIERYESPKYNGTAYKNILKNYFNSRIHN